MAALFALIVKTLLVVKYIYYICLALLLFPVLVFLVVLGLLAQGSTGILEYLTTKLEILHERHTNANSKNI